MHTNVCLGKPCADPAKIPSLLDENGNLKSSRTYREAWKRGEEITNLDEMVIEIEAQYHRYLELVGEKPHYFEAHAVMNANLSKGLAIVAEKYDLPYLPTSFEPTGTPFCGHTLITCMDSMKPGYDPFASLQKAVLARVRRGPVPHVRVPPRLHRRLPPPPFVADGPRPMRCMATDPRPPSSG